MPHKSIQRQLQATGNTHIKPIMMNAATRITSRTAVTRRFVSSLATNAGKRKPTNLHHLSTLPFRQVIRPTVVQTFSTGGARTPSSREPVAQPPVIHLQASADLKNQTTLTEAVANAISRCGGHLSTQMIDNDTNISTFVFENVGSEKLAAFHSLLEAMVVDWNQNTRRLLEDSYFSLFGNNSDSNSSIDENNTAVLQLQWR